MNVASRLADHHSDEVAACCEDGRMPPLGAVATKATRDQLTCHPRCTDIPEVLHRQWPVDPNGEP